MGSLVELDFYEVPRVVEVTAILVAVVNEVFAKQFGGQNPLGRRVDFRWPGANVADLSQRDPGGMVLAL